MRKRASTTGRQCLHRRTLQLMAEPANRGDRSMVRLAVAAVSLALLCAAAYFAPWPWLSGFWPGAAVVPLFSAIALIVSLVAAAAAFRAMRNTGKLRDDILLLARSIDVALRDVAARTDKETATISEMSGAVAREIERLSERIAHARRHRRRRPRRKCRQCRAASGGAPAARRSGRCRGGDAGARAWRHRSSVPQGGRGRRVRHLAAADRFGIAQRGERLRSIRQPAGRGRRAHRPSPAGANAAGRRIGGVRAHPGRRRR